MESKSSPATAASALVPSTAMQKGRGNAGRGFGRPGRGGASMSPGLAGVAGWSGGGGARAGGPAAMPFPPPRTRAPPPPPPSAPAHNMNALVMQMAAHMAVKGYAGRAGGMTGLTGNLNRDARPPTGPAVGGGGVRGGGGGMMNPAAMIAAMHGMKGAPSVDGIHASRGGFARQGGPGGSGMRGGSGPPIAAMQVRSSSSACDWCGRWPGC